MAACNAVYTSNTSLLDDQRHQTVELMAELFTYPARSVVDFFRGGDWTNCSEVNDDHPSGALCYTCAYFSSRKEYRVATGACEKIQPDVILQPRYYSDPINKL